MSSLQLLREEAIDRLVCIVHAVPKYKQTLNDLINNFTVDDTIKLIGIIDRDKDFRSLKHFSTYSQYFDDIEEMIIG